MPLSTYQDFLIAVPFGKAFEASLAGFFPAVDLFLYTPISQWETAEFRREINRCFFESITETGNQKDPHLARSLYGSIRVKTKKRGPNDDESRQYLLLAEHVGRSLKIEKSFRDRWEKAIGAESAWESFPTYDDDEEDLSPARPPSPRQWLLSPLSFVKDILTDPEYPASEAFAHALIRAHIFAEAVNYARDLEGRTAVAEPKPRRASDNRDRLPNDAQAIIRTLTSFEAVEASLRKIRTHRQRRDNFYPSTATDFIVAHLLAARDYLVLGFAPEREVIQRKKRHERDIVGRRTFLEKRDLLPDGNKGEKILYEFRVVDEVARLPSTSELMNEIDGVPVPLTGADVVFARGLRTTHERNLIGRISGRSGSGKTSFALALATALAPFGTRTIYLSCEEEARDLSERISTLTPEFISRTNSFPSDTNDWFKATHFDRDVVENYHDIRAFVDNLKQDMAVQRKGGHLPSPVGLTPFLVVLDGVHELLLRDMATSYKIDDGIRLRRLVEQFRGLESIVLILSADTGESALRELDYVVDIAGTLQIEKEREDHPDRPSRVFILHKTRRQFARTGVHRVHISGRDGIQLSPQVAAQRDTFRNFTWTPVGRDIFFDVLRADRQASLFNRDTDGVKLFERSLILVSGKGSSGKAGFALKILCAPLLQNKDSPDRWTTRHSADLRRRNELGKSPRAIRVEDSSQQMPLETRRRGVLIMSFLYPKSFFEDLLIRIKRAFEIDGSHLVDPPSIQPDVLHFYPGSLKPEALLRKILRRMERMRLYGVPIRGVLVDGIHNVYLQFPDIESSPHVWPVLYELFRLLRVTVVTTHTHFQVRGVEPSESVAVDVDTVNRRIAPLLNVLVGTVDNYIEMSSMDEGEPQRFVGAEGASRRYEIKVLSAFEQDVEDARFEWDRQRLAAFSRP